MKRAISAILLTVLWGGTVYGQQLPGDSLASDFRTLVRYLVETHPDPYSAFGGKVFFHKQAYETGQNLKEGATREEFAQTVLAFLSKLNDGHTRISVPQQQTTSLLRLPLTARATPDGLAAIVVPEEHRELIGSRVVSVGGVTVGELTERLGRLTPAENVFDAYSTLSSAIIMHRLMSQLIPDLGVSIAVELERAPGDVVEITLDYLSPDQYAALPMASRPKWAKVDESEYMSYGFLDGGRKAMLFRLTNVVSREALLDMRQNEIPGVEDMLTLVYTHVLRHEKPADTDEAIAAIPSLAETFRAMLTEMKAADAPYLIIDLRDNDGGFTPIVPATLYQLWGDRYLETDMGVRFYRMASPLYMQKLGTTLEEINAAQGTAYEYGDYTFGDDESDARPIEQKRRDFTEGIYGGDPSPVADLDGKPVYTPERVFVVTNDGTFSAAFHYAFYLWRMGATVVGVPSSQAPNTFMESTPFELPYTGLGGSISNSTQVFLPGDDPRAKVFWPDVMLSPDDYRRYGFDKHAELMYLVDYLNLE